MREDTQDYKVGDKVLYKVDGGSRHVETVVVAICSRGDTTGFDSLPIVEYDQGWKYDNVSPSEILEGEVKDRDKRYHFAKRCFLSLLEPPLPKVINTYPIF